MNMYNRERYIEAKERIFKAYAQRLGKKREELTGFDIWSSGSLYGMFDINIEVNPDKRRLRQEINTKSLEDLADRLEKSVKKPIFDENHKMLDNITNAGQTTSTISSGDYTTTTVAISPNSTIDYFYKAFNGPVKEYKDFGFNDLVNYGSYNFIDISGEVYRIYTFPDGYEVRLDNPVALAVSESGHRIFDNLGKCYYVPNGWRLLTWEVRPGEPHFVK